MSARPLGGFVAIPISDIRPSPNNPRAELHDIAELALSIRENGLIQPIVVQRILGTDRYQIVAGHRRREACARLGMATVPCIVRRDMLPDEELVAMLVENGQRAGLDPIEEARALKRLVDAGQPPADVAKRIGRHISHVRGRLLLLDLPPAEQEELRAGHYTLQHATQLVRDAREAQRRREARRRGLWADRRARPRNPTSGPHTPCLAPYRPAVTTAAPRSSPASGCGPCWEAVIRDDEQGGRP